MQQAAIIKQQQKQEKYKLPEACWFDVAPLSSNYYRKS
jgi:hypothetical protein